MTFAVSMLERDVEEQAREESREGSGVRASVVEIIGNPSRLQPGSEQPRH